MGAIDVSHRNGSRWLCRDAAGSRQQGRRQGVHRDVAGAGMRGCTAHGSAGDLYGCCNRAVLARAGLASVQPGDTAAAHGGASRGRCLAVTIALTQPITGSDTNDKSDRKSNSHAKPDTDASAEYPLTAPTRHPPPTRGRRGRRSPRRSPGRRSRPARGRCARVGCLPLRRRRSRRATVRRATRPARGLRRRPGSGL